ncbi:hypothetical protein ACMFMF_009761 [Clarireedia jacksonii]
MRPKKAVTKRAKEQEEASQEQKGCRLLLRTASLGQRPARVTALIMPVLGLGVSGADRYFFVILTRIIIIDVHCSSTAHSKDGIKLCTTGIFPKFPFPIPLTAMASNSTRDYISFYSVGAKMNK